MANCEIETGYQLFTRLTTRPSLENIYPILIPNSGPSKQEVIEVVGDTGTGKTLLITEILARCLLPENQNGLNIGGKNSGAVLINTDHHFRISKLKETMQTFLENCNCDSNELSPTEINEIVLKSLDKLVVLNCFSSEEMYVTFHNLDNVLTQNDKVSLVVLDSISAYYWTDRLLDGMKKIGSYQKVILKTLQNITKEYKCVLVYTKPSHFLSKGESFEKCSSTIALEKINYRIFLEKDKDGIFGATVTLPDNTTTKKFYKISQTIEWFT